MAEPVLCQTLDLSRVMTCLADRRRVFHSEADFKFAFAQTVAELEHSVDLRLEVPVRQPGGARQTVDLVCRGQATTFVEFKYFTQAWIGDDPHTREHFHLLPHGATDVVRLNLVHDVRRLERFVDGSRADSGLAVLLTNDSALWRSPRRARANDQEFRLNEGATLTGMLRWAGDESSRHTHTLRGTYTARWKDYASPLDGPNGVFRWLALAVGRQF